MTEFRDLFFSRALAAWVLLLLPLLLLCLFQAFYKNRRVINTLFSKELQDQLIVCSSTRLFWLKTVAFTVAFLLITIALMGPKGHPTYQAGEGEEEEAAAKAPHDIYVLLDDSLSMTVEDMPGGTSRLQFALETIDDFIERLGGENIALTLFTSRDLSLVPPTTNYLYMRLMLSQVKPNQAGKGTRIVAALNNLFTHLMKRPPLLRKTVLLFSDGEEPEKNLPHTLPEEGALIEHSIELVAVGLGSAKGAPIPNFVWHGAPVVSSLDASLLKNLAKYSGGEYVDSLETPLATAKALLDRVVEEPPTLKEKIEMRYTAPLHKQQRPVQELSYESYDQIPLFFALFLLAFYLFYPERGKGRGRI